MIKEFLLRDHEYVAGRVARSVTRILDSTSLGSLATATAQQGAHVNTVYFCWTEDLEIFFLSDPGTVHGRNLAERPDAAMAVYSTRQGWGDDHTGLQLFGECSLAEGHLGATAERGYAERFPEYRAWYRQLKDAERHAFAGRFYIFKPAKLKMLDESEFGEEVIVEARVVRGGA